MLPMAAPIQNSAHDDTLSRRCRMLARSYGEHSLDEFGSEDDEHGGSAPSPAASSSSPLGKSPNSLKSPGHALFSPPPTVKNLHGPVPPSPSSFSSHALDEIQEEAEGPKAAGTEADDELLSPRSAKRVSFENRQLDSPIKSAFTHGTMCVSVDVWLVDGRLLVGPDANTLTPSRTLEKLYIEPLLNHFAPENIASPTLQGRRRSSQTFAGIVHNLPFLLSITLRSEPTMLFQYLSFALTALDDEGLLTTYSEHAGILSPGQITVVLSGDVPIDDILQQGTRFIFAETDSLQSNLGKHVAPVVRFQLRDLAERHSPFALDEHDKQAIQALTREVHASHRLIRVDGLPKFPIHEREAMHDALRDCGVDYCT